MPHVEDSLPGQVYLPALWTTGNYVTIPSVSLKTSLRWLGVFIWWILLLIAVTVPILYPSLYPCSLTCDLVQPSHCDAGHVTCFGQLDIC